VFLASVMSGVSRATVQRWIRQGRVLLDGTPCQAKTRLFVGAVLEVTPGPPPPSRAEPDASVQLELCFQDEHLVVVNKPAGLVVHPARGHALGTLVNGLLALPGFRRPPADPRDPEGPMRPGIVHRIDKDTSGLLVVARDEPTREGLKRQFAAHTIVRSYLGISIGVPAPGTVTTTHQRHPKNRLKFTSLGERGRTATTHIEVVERFGGRAALVRCRLETGRTHQIRVHLAEQCRTPLLADALYGADAVDPVLAAISDQLGRQALHAGQLGFRHPVTGQELQFEAKLPPDMQQTVEQLRAASSGPGAQKMRS
jgi:23S rRNA pseudouridine1911/1915/1917 synthase